MISSQSSPSGKSASVAVVTGAAGGIGLALIAGLLSAGQHVVAVVRTQSSVARLPANPTRMRLVPVVADLATQDGRDTIERTVRMEFGSLGVLVNNAGVGMGSIRPDYYKRAVQLREIDGGIVERFLAINAHAPIVLALALLPLFHQSWGRIINIGTSLTAMLRPGFLPYAMSKAALEAGSAVLAADLATSGISVNVINPGGPVDTPMARREEPELRAAMLAPEALVAPVLWLASHRSDGVSGKRITASRWKDDDPQSAMAPIGWPQLANDSTWQ